MKNNENETPKTKIIPFLYYIKDGKCKADHQMPQAPEAFDGWLSAAHILRNQGKHLQENVALAKMGLREFIGNLKPCEQMQQKDLTPYAQ